MSSAATEDRDPSTYTEEEKAIIAKYGRLPKQSDIVKKRNQKLQQGKPRFDSADWEMHKNDGKGNK